MGVTKTEKKNVRTFSESLTVNSFYSKMASEGFSFDPSKPAVVNVADKDSLINSSLDDIIKAKSRQFLKDRKSRPANAAGTRRRRTTTRTTATKTRTTQRARSTSSTSTKTTGRTGTARTSTRKSSVRGSSSNKIELKVPESALKSILDEAGIDSSGYKLRLVAFKK